MVIVISVTGVIDMTVTIVIDFVFFISIKVGCRFFYI